MTRLPPLKSLQAFDAAARHLSFKRAAEELNVTPTAISHRIRTLEEHLGHRLFHRLTRAIRLTAAGEAYAPSVREGFARLEAASDALGQTAEAGELVVTTTMSFATKWLTPRLHRFAERHPDITVRVLATDQPLDFGRHNVDLAIRYGPGDLPGEKGEKGDLFVAWVLTDRAAPVCAPAFPVMRGGEPTPAEIAASPLIHYEWDGRSGRDPGWRTWFEAAGIATDGDIPASAVYSDEHMCVQAAIDGHGIALAGLIAAAGDIEAGRLVPLGDISLKSKSYVLVCPAHRAELPRHAAFREWLLEEADRFRETEIGRLLEHRRGPGDG